MKYIKEYLMVIVGYHKIIKNSKKRYIPIRIFNKIRNHEYVVDIGLLAGQKFCDKQ